MIFENLNKEELIFFSHLEFSHNKTKRQSIFKGKKNITSNQQIIEINHSQPDN